MVCVLYVYINIFHAYGMRAVHLYQVISIVSLAHSVSLNPKTLKHFLHGFTCTFWVKVYALNEVGHACVNLLRIPWNCMLNPIVSSHQVWLVRYLRRETL